MTDPMLDLALSYASRGWPVFPCRPADDYDPETGEVLPEKAPLVSNGFRGATLNERVIRELWKRNPGALVGIPTGDRTGVWVLDLDVKTNANGHEWLATQEDIHGDLPYSARVQTANNGTHIFFRHVEGVRNRGKLGAGVDVRGEGGFVIAGGSEMGDGRAYHWLDDTGPDDVTDAPQWLLDLVTPPVIQRQEADWNYNHQGNDRYVKRAVEAELNELACTPQGNRGYQLNASAFALGTIVGAGALDRSEAEHGLYSAAVTCGVAQADGERETWAKIRRGLDAGEKQPRHIPQPDQDNTRLVDIKRMLERAREKAANKTAKNEGTGSEVSENHIQISDSEPAKNSPEPVSTDSETSPEAETNTTAHTNRDSVSNSEELPVFAFTPFSWKDPASLPRREFAFGKHYIRKYVSVTVAPGGLGKTSNSVVEALSMASGKDLTGDKPPKRLKVWLFNAEDPRDEMDRRIMAACLHYGLSPSDIEGHLFLDTGREQELIVMQEDKKAGVTINAPVVSAVVEQIHKHKIDVMIVDPFVSTHRVNENDNGAIDKVAKLWAQIADDTNCAVDVVHHLRKLSDREGTIEDARGAISLIGAARSVRVLNRMTAEDANAAGIDDKERFSYFNIHYGKSNLTRMDMAQHWRKLESVSLGNSRSNLVPSDTAGVVTSWRWPSSEDIVNDLTKEQISNIKSVLAGRAYKAAPQGKPWAGEAIAYVLGEDLDDKAAKKRVGALLKAMLKEGILGQVDDRDPVSRSVIKAVR